jgi:molybdenum cofactor cytidylyltransferase
MGAWKPLLPFGRSTIAETVVSTALVACPRVILVVGHRGPELEALFAGEPRVRVVANPVWRQGMFSSLLCGMAEVATPRFFVTPGDMPWITAGVYERLLECPPADAVFPVFAGRRGHPVLFDAKVRYTAESAGPGAASGMREIAAGLACAEVPWEDDSVLRDIDVPEDRR